MGTIPTATDPGAEAERCPPPSEPAAPAGSLTPIARQRDGRRRVARERATDGPYESERAREGAWRNGIRNNRARNGVAGRRGYRLPTFVVTGRRADVRLGDSLSLQLFTVKISHPSWHLPITRLQDVGDSATELHNVLSVAPTERVGAVGVSVAYSRMTQR